MGLKERIPLAAEIEVMEASSAVISRCHSRCKVALPLVHWPKLLVLLDHLEKSSIFSAELQAAWAWPAKPAAMPIRKVARILNVVKRECWRTNVRKSKTPKLDGRISPNRQSDQDDNSYGTSSSGLRRRYIRSRYRGVRHDTCEICLGCWAYRLSRSNPGVSGGHASI